MGRTPESDNIHNEFVVKMKEMGKRHNYVFVAFRELEREDKSFKIFRNKEVYMIIKGDKFYAVFVKVSAIKKSFWGLSKRLYDEFQELECPNQHWERFVIFLSSPSRGYLLKASEFDELKTSLRIIRGEYKIEERELDDIRFEFLGLDDLLKSMGLLEEVKKETR